MIRWEYHLESLVWTAGTREAQFQKRLNELGSEGWELVTRVMDELGYGSYHVCLAFKRPIKE